MKKRVVLCVLTGAAMILASAFAARTFIADDDSRDVNLLPYDKTAERMIEGTVQEKMHIVGPGQDPVYFTLKTAAFAMEVYIGPQEFVKRAGFNLSVGETVTVIGAPATFRDRKVLLARSVFTDDGMLVIRDHNGNRMWMEGPVEMDPECPLQDEASVR